MYEYEYLILMNEKQKEIERIASQAWKYESFSQFQRPSIFQKIFQRKKQNTLLSNTCCCTTC
ncbi:hypothetical protein C0971_02155 [Bacillus methanolicus]|nr:hypothetical protein C0971_02155 [Bacillus methanolicus]